MKNKYHFVISFNDLSQEKKMEIRSHLEKEVSISDELGYLIDEGDRDDLSILIGDYVENACDRAWTELEIVIGSETSEDKWRADAYMEESK